MNNRIYCIRAGSQITAVVKQYYHSPDNPRDRLSSDYGFSCFLWDNGIRQIPEPLAADAANHLALFKHISGRKLTSSEITPEHIDQILNFYFAMNDRPAQEAARLLPCAAEACFTLGEHIQVTERRIQRLQTIRGRSDIEKKAEHFVHADLVPEWEKIKNAAFLTAKTDNLALDTAIPLQDNRLSPSDFGFHNALEDKTGTLIFMDFEYAGWDDPAKMVCDLFYQPQIPLPRKYYSHIIDKVVQDLSDPENHRRRIGLLFPVYSIKWCSIILNEFLPRGRSRRDFLEGEQNPDIKKGEQLIKAMKVIENIRNGET